MRMMGEITATLRGNIRVANSFDFVELFCLLAGLDRKCAFLAEYICELCLLQVEMGQYKPTEIAAASVLLARLLMRLGMYTKPKDLVVSLPALMTMNNDMSRVLYSGGFLCYREGGSADIEGNIFILLFTC